MTVKAGTEDTVLGHTKRSQAMLGLPAMVQSLTVVGELWSKQ
jgi:hypothetical protein